MKLTPETTKAIVDSEFYDESMFESDCTMFIKALKAGRVTLTTTRHSYASSDLYVQSYEGTMAKGWFRQYVRMLECLGFKILGNRSARISGMPYDVNRLLIYKVIRRLVKNGLLTEKKAQALTSDCGF